MKCNMQNVLLILTRQRKNGKGFKICDMIDKYYILCLNIISFQELITEWFG